MPRKLTVIPEQCSGCRLCELVCAIKHYGVNNPKKSAVRVICTYPHPVVRMPVVCSQCKDAKCMAACPTDALYKKEGIVRIHEDECIGCHACVDACPFGAMYAHEDCDYPIKCDMCGGDPRRFRRPGRDTLAARHSTPLFFSSGSFLFPSFRWPRAM